MCILITSQDIELALVVNVVRAIKLMVDNKRLKEIYHNFVFFLIYV